MQKSPIPVPMPDLQPGMTPKQKIEEIVAFYIRMYPDEWKLFCDYAKEVRSTQGLNKWAEMEGSDVIERKLGEKPEKLHALLQTFLTKEEWAWLNPDGLNNKSMQGPNWFFKRYPEMRITKDI